MKIVVAHTDFRIYWPARLELFRRKAEALGWGLQVIEISGHGSPYSFAGRNENVSGNWWSCLFPEKRMEDIPPALASKRLYQALDRENPDVVVAGAIAFPSGAAAVRWARERGRRVIIFDDARQQDVRRNSLVNWIKRRVYANVDAVLVPAPSHLPDFQCCGFLPERIFFGVDVVDNSFFSELAASVRENSKQARRSLELPNRFLLGVGRQVPKKNWSGLIESWVLHCSQHPDSELELVLVGNGPEHESMVSLVQNNRVPKVIFRDFLDSAMLGKYYALADAVVLPSLFGETWGLVVNEAMAAGLPVLVSRECGCCEALVEEGKNGWSFDPKNNQEMADCIRRLDALTREEWMNMGAASSARISEWGLERFSSGLYDAVQFVTQHTKWRGTLLDIVILKLWHGRYRPS